MKYDNLLKTIFYDAMPSVLRGLHCAPLEEYLSVEFPARPKLVADVVARLADGKILHIEFQLTNDPRMHWRCYYYFGAIQEQWEDAEVLQVVIYLGNGPLTRRHEIEKPRLKYRYDILDIKEFDPETFLESGTTPRECWRCFVSLEIRERPYAACSRPGSICRARSCSRTSIV